MRTSSPAIDDRIVACAGPGGVVTAEALAHAHINHASVATRVKAGWLEHWHRGLFVVAHLRSDLTPASLVQARCPNAVAMGRTAAWMYGLDGFDRLADLPPEVIAYTEHVTPRRHHGKIPNLFVAAVGPADVCIRHGLRVLKPLPTLVSLGALVDLDTLEAATESVLRRYSRRHLKAALLEEQISNLASSTPVSPGQQALLHVMERRGWGTPPTESYLETRAIQRVLRPAGLAHWRQVPVWANGAFVGRFDFELESGLLVETHGMATHATKAGVQRDAWRATSLRLAGRDVESITWDDVHRRPGITGRRLRRRSEQIAIAIAARGQIEQVFAKVEA